MEKLLTVTDISALLLGVSTGQFLGETESNIEFEQVFGCGRKRKRVGPWKAPLPGAPLTLILLGSLKLQKYGWVRKMHKESLLEVIDFIANVIDELEDELVPLDEVADTDEELEKVKELQDKVDALSQLSLALMSNEWEN